MLTVKNSPPARLPQSEMQMLHRLELGRMGGSSHMATMYVETMKTEPVWWGEGRTSETISCVSEVGRGIQLCLKPEVEQAKTWTITSLCCSYCFIQVIFYLDRKISELKRDRVEEMGLLAVLLVSAC